ncbi:LytTR family DNA-binding domain-containing protein [Mucilaginibacter sp. RS28]|uniref:LytTR family DNA-binding domain-containing protein n=1 Tax=Mucilaginibacter straminoryzae TaxID=2932774 RepID=A0A9X1X423_9SPHI|nr:LytTR family DNA-binding domain-containing protein [Mucilaginibacter straminoryzae]MCJ8208099.1 LytTR family DNA-binding domain-containing protein [Mucilaginibacter straminoryzae]
MKLRCYVVDDDPVIVEWIAAYIKATPELEFIGSDTKEERALQRILSGAIDADIVFLDIMMPNINGLEFASQIKDLAHVVLVTADKSKAVRAYEDNMFDYLVKPVTRKRFDLLVTKLLDWFNNQSLISKGHTTLYLQSAKKGNYIHVHTNNILFVEGASNYVTLYMRRGEPIRTNHSLYQMEELLPANCFRRVHKRFIINTDYVVGIKNGTIVMRGGFLVLIGPTYMDGFMKEVIARKGLK